MLPWGAALRRVRCMLARSPAAQMTIMPRPNSALALDRMIARMDLNGLCLQWRNRLGGSPTHTRFDY